MYYIRTLCCRLQCSARWLSILANDDARLYAAILTWDRCNHSRRKLLLYLFCVIHLFLTPTSYILKTSSLLSRILVHGLHISFEVWIDKFESAGNGQWNTKLLFQHDDRQLVCEVLGPSQCSGTRNTKNGHPSRNNTTGADCYVPPSILKTLKVPAGARELTS